MAARLESLRWDILKDGGVGMLAGCAMQFLPVSERLKANMWPKGT